MRIFLDANVLFSAAYRAEGTAHTIFMLAATGACTLVCSAHAIEEARRNLAARYPQRLSELAKLCEALEVCPEPRPETLGLATAEDLPPKDAPILAAAMEARCHLLATGDRRDFGHLLGRRVHGTLVILPADVLALLLG